MSDAWERIQPLVLLDEDWLRGFLARHVGTISELASHDLGGQIGSNYRLGTNRGDYFLRIVDDAEGIKKETALRTRLTGLIHVPATIASEAWNSHFVVLQQWLPGETLRSALENAGRETVEVLGNTVGELLSRLKDVQFDTHGFLDSAGSIARPFDMRSKGYLDYVGEALNYAHPSMGRELADNCWKFAQTHARFMDELPDEANLCHGDLHLNSLLVESTAGGWQVKGMVDWQAALAWLSVHDLAHVVRRPMPDRDGFERGLISGYVSGGGELPGDWPTVRGLLQLLAWVDNLAAGESRPQVVAWACKCMREIVTP